MSTNFSISTSVVRTESSGLRPTFSGSDEQKPVKIFYHIYCNENTKPIVIDQINKITFSGLYEKTQQIFCFITGKQNYISDIAQLIQKCGKKYLVIAVGIDDTSYERFTLLKIREFISPGEKILYIHSKGVSHDNTIQYQGWVPGLPTIKENVANWRTFMEFYLIAKHPSVLNY
jgi:hypothetical protein